MEDQIRVLRIIEYVGTRSNVERQISSSLQGTTTVLLGAVRIRVTDLGNFPEVVFPPINLEE